MKLISTLSMYMKEFAVDQTPSITNTNHQFIVLGGVGSTWLSMTLKEKQSFHEYEEF